MPRHHMVLTQFYIHLYLNWPQDIVYVCVFIERSKEKEGRTDERNKEGIKAWGLDRWQGDMPDMLMVHVSILKPHGGAVAPGEKAYAVVSFPFSTSLCLFIWMKMQPRAMKSCCARSQIKSVQTMQENIQIYTWKWISELDI